ncbi:hypothetical protein TNCV_2099541 [Trichonephila clavipes]|nr:hypothetical protein TNCV_2099541 [Trichonephila clavipes]
MKQFGSWKTVQIRKHSYRISIRKILGILFHKFIDSIIINLQFCELERHILVDYRLYRYGIKFLKIAFESTLHPKLLPSQTDFTSSPPFLSN